MVQDLEVVDTFDPAVHDLDGHVADIIDLAAAHATHVVVSLRIAVEARLRTCGGQFLDHTIGGQQLEVAIHRRQADSGQARPDDLIEVGRGRVRRQFPQFLEDHTALAGVSADELSGHGPIHYQ